MQSESPRDGRALREMAKLAGPASKPPVKRPNPNADSSGLVDLAALMAEQPNWLDDALARAKSAAGTSVTPVSLGPSSLGPTFVEMADVDAMGVPRRRVLPLLTASVTAALVTIEP